MGWKKILKITFSILIPIAVLWGGYSIWKALTTPDIPPPIGANKPTGLAVDLPEAQKLTALSRSAIFDYWVNYKTGAIYFLNLSGQVIKKTGDSEEPANSQTIDKLNSVQPSPDGTFAVAKFNYPALPTFSIFNTVTNAWQPLPQDTIATAWATSSQQLAYLENKNNAGTLKILNIVSQKTQEVVKMNQKDVRLAWIDPPEIFFITSSPAADLPSSLWSINIKNKTLKPLIKDESGLTINWSKEGDLGLKLKSDKRAPKISLIDNLGNTLREFSFITLPEKCAIEKGKLYCGIPKFLREGLVLPDDYYKKAVYFQDDLYSIDLASGAVSLLFNGDETLIDACHLSIQGGQLLFINRYDNKLYSLQL